jgi:MATE family multidrug resistance protein
MQSPLAFWLMSALALAITAALFVALLVSTVRRRR